MSPGPQAFVRLKPAPGGGGGGNKTLSPAGLSMAFSWDPPTLVGSSTVPGLVMNFGLDGANVVLGSTSTTGIVVQSNPNGIAQSWAPAGPNAVIDPIGGRSLALGSPDWPVTTLGGVKDSTAGLQAFINSTPLGSVITLPFDLRVNGQVIVSGGRTLQTSDPINGKKMLKRDVAYPWRVEPDLRTTVGGASNPAYNQFGICAPWLYDVAATTVPVTGTPSGTNNAKTGGGPANEPLSFNNPYGFDTTNQPMGAGSQYGNYDGTTGWRNSDASSPTPAALNTSPRYDGLHFYTRITAPFTPSVNNMILTCLAFNRTLTASIGYWGGLSPSYALCTIDPDGVTVRLPAGHTGFFNNEFIGGNIASVDSAGPTGAIKKADATLFQSGTTVTARSADGSSCTISKKTNHTTTGTAIQVAFPNGGHWNKFIRGVAADQKSVTLENDIGVVHTDPGTGCSNWCIGPNGKVGWGAIFQPNPKWNPTYYGGDFHAYPNAIEQATFQNGNDLCVVSLRDTSVLRGLIIEGPNMTWRDYLRNFDRSQPMVQEFMHGVDGGNGWDRTTLVHSKIDHCEIRNMYGCAEEGGCDLTNSYFHDLGRQAAVGHGGINGPAAPNGKLIDHCVIERTHGGCIDIEGPPVPVTFTNNTLGGPQGMSFTTATNNFTYTGNHSTQADIDAGTIGSLAPLIRGTSWGAAGSQTWLIHNNHFDIDVTGLSHSSAYVITGVNGLTLTNNTGPLTSKTFLAEHNCSNIVQSGNDGGPNCIPGTTAF